MTYGDLRDIPRDAFLFDWETGDRFSADRGDYFMFSDRDEIEGGLILAREVCEIEVLAQ